MSRPEKTEGLRERKRRETRLRLNVDPLALRKSWDDNPARARLYDWAMGLDVWKSRPTAPGEGRYRRGVGVAAGYWL